MPSTKNTGPAKERYRIGDLVGGKYELLGKAGEGAMGAVWVATNTALGSRVAIKVIHPEMTLPMIAERLLREARAAAMLTHSATVRVFDLGETERGDPYIVMELLEGESLQVLLTREGALPPEAALPLVLPIAGAMQAAHELGIIHRDLKPENIVLARVDGGRIQPKVVDFGIAKLRWTEEGTLSTGGLVVGTPRYMSPEQAGGGATVDHRSDVWSFCVMLYEMLAGERPFDGENTWQVLCAVVHEPVPSLADRSIIGPELWAIVERGLRKEPSERWQSMRELGEALARWLLSREVHEDVVGASLHAQWVAERPSVHASALLRPPPLIAPALAPAKARTAPPARSLHLPLPRPARSPIRWAEMIGALGLMVSAAGWAALPLSLETTRLGETPTVEPAPAPQPAPARAVEPPAPAGPGFGAEPHREPVGPAEPHREPMPAFIAVSVDEPRESSSLGSNVSTCSRCSSR